MKEDTIENRDLQRRDRESKSKGTKKGHCPEGSTLTFVTDCWRICGMCFSSTRMGWVGQPGSFLYTPDPVFPATILTSLGSAAWSLSNSSEKVVGRWKPGQPKLAADKLKPPSACIKAHCYAQQRIMQDYCLGAAMRSRVNRDACMPI